MMHTVLTVNWGEVSHVVFFGMAMVFIILIFLVFAISIMGRILAPKIQILRKRVRKKNSITEENGTKKIKVEYVQEHLSANKSAAIGMALYLYYAEMHDEESEVMTIKTVERRYSPWSSKIYGIK